MDHLGHHLPAPEGDLAEEAQHGKAASRLIRETVLFEVFNRRI